MEDNSESFPVLKLDAQVAVIRMNTMIGETRAEAYYPRMCLWVDAQSGMILSFEMVPPQEEYLSLVIDTLRKLPGKIGGLPKQIQLRDPRLARELRHALDQCPIEVVVRESLPTLDEAISSLMDFGAIRGRRKPHPGLLDVPAMELDHVIDFAEAAKAFYEARPWQYLIDDDLIEIHEPAGPKGTRYTQVLGAAGQTFGLGFVGKIADHEAIRAGGGIPRGGAWSMLFSDIDNIPFADGELWERQNLPVADNEAYPSFGKYTKSKGFSHPDPEQLAWAEGLLRSLAATTEAELDSGRWEKTVETSSGEMKFRFSLPMLLEQMAGQEIVDPVRQPWPTRMSLESTMHALGQQIRASGAKTVDEMNRVLETAKDSEPEFIPGNDAERAQLLCYKAYDARGRWQIHLARQALAIDPDCCEAMLILAERISDPEEAIPQLQRAVDAGARQLGAERFEKDAGHFWGIFETRPYMRAEAHLPRFSWTSSDSRRPPIISGTCCASIQTTTRDTGTCWQPSCWN